MELTSIRRVEIEQKKQKTKNKTKNSCMRATERVSGPVAVCDWLTERVSVGLSERGSLYVTECVI